MGPNPSVTACATRSETSAIRFGAAKQALNQIRDRLSCLYSSLPQPSSLTQRAAPQTAQQTIKLSIAGVNRTFHIGTSTDVNNATEFFRSICSPSSPLIIFTSPTSEFRHLIIVDRLGMLVWDLSVAGPPPGSKNFERSVGRAGFSIFLISAWTLAPLGRLAIFIRQLMYRLVL